MAFYNEITQYNTLTTTHCDNFNEVNQKLLENTLQNHQDIGNLNLLSTTQKDSLVSAVNEVKQSIPSSTNINQTIDQKISTHNQLTTSHQDIRSQVKTLENQIQGINISANIETHNTNQTAHQDIRSEINVLSTDRGYLTSKDINNMDDLKFNGKFIFSGEIEGITASWHVDVTSGINTHLQIATTTWDNTGNTRGITLTRIFCDGKWSGWKQLATTTKTDILFTPKPSFTILNQKNSKINNILHINVEVGKTDGSMFTGGQFVNVVTLPFNVWNTTISMIGSYEGFFQIAGCGIAYETHLSVIPSKECQSIRISGVIIL